VQNAFDYLSALGYQFKMQICNMKTVAKITVNRWISLGLLLMACVLLFVLSYFPTIIEVYYSVGCYPFLAKSLRYLTGFIPFSIGDIGYVFTVIYLIYNALQLVLKIKQRSINKQLLNRIIFKLLKTGLWCYLIFKLFWGLNYDRLGIAHQLSLAPKKYSKEAVVAITHQLIDSLNACRRQFKDSVLPNIGSKIITEKAVKGYAYAAVNWPFLNYTQPSVKQSLYSVVGDYIGFTGYFNPITGEAQVRSDIPNLLVPYITCHEMAHQLGYASESEANFVGYLTATASKDLYFRYSAYLELFSYAQSEEVLLFGKEKDFKAFEATLLYNRTHLDSLVIKDRKAIRAFFQKRQNRLSPAVTSMYDQYLKLNKQAAGIDSYNEVIGWLIAYQQKNGGI